MKLKWFRTLSRFIDSIWNPIKVDRHGIHYDRSVDSNGWEKQQMFFQFYARSSWISPSLRTFVSTVLCKRNFGSLEELCYHFWKKLFVPLSLLNMKVDSMLKFDIFLKLGDRTMFFLFYKKDFFRISSTCHFSSNHERRKNTVQMKYLNLIKKTARKQIFSSTTKIYKKVRVGEKIFVQK